MDGWVDGWIQIVEICFSGEVIGNDACLLRFEDCLGVFEESGTVCASLGVTDDIRGRGEEKLRDMTGTARLHWHHSFLLPSLESRSID